MKKYIELSITGKESDINSFVKQLEKYSSDAFRFSEIRDSGLSDGSLLIEFQAKRAIDYKARIILACEDGCLSVSNIIPNTISFLEMEQYNSVLRHFYEDVILRADTAALDVGMTKEENAMVDLISAPAYDALVKWEHACDRNAPTAHPMDRERWMDFICELHDNSDNLSLSDFRNWLIYDKGWYYDPEDEDDRTLTNLELDLEYGLDLLEHYAEKTIH